MMLHSMLYVLVFELVSRLIRLPEFYKQEFRQVFLLKISLKIYAKIIFGDFLYFGFLHSYFSWKWPFLGKKHHTEYKKIHNSAKIYDFLIK